MYNIHQWKQKEKLACKQNQRMWLVNDIGIFDVQRDERNKKRIWLTALYLFNPEEGPTNLKSLYELMRYVNSRGSFALDQSASVVDRITESKLEFRKVNRNQIKRAEKRDKERNLQSFFFSQIDSMRLMIAVLCVLFRRYIFYFLYRNKLRIGNSNLVFGNISWNFAHGPLRITQQNKRFKHLHCSTFCTTMWYWSMA